MASGEPIDVVMHNAFPARHALWEQYTLIKYIPFNPVDKLTVAVVRENATGRTLRVMKGAPQVTLSDPIKNLRRALRVRPQVSRQPTAVHADDAFCCRFQ